MRPQIVSVAGQGATLACGQWPGSGAPVLALHGITSSLMSFVGVAEKLAGARPLYALDLRGHGDSDKLDGPYTIEAHARDVASVIRAQRLGPCAIVGHSFGAYVAVALAASSPELVSALVLVDGGYPPIPPPGVHPRAFAEMAMAPSLGRVERTHASASAYVAAWHALPGLEGARGDWIDLFAAHDAGGAPPHVRSKVDPTAVRVAYYEMLDIVAIEARLQHVAAPLVIVRAQWGAARGLPPIMTDDAVDAVRRRVRSASVCTVGDANHYTIVLADAGAKIIAALCEEVS